MNTAFEDGIKLLQETDAAGTQEVLNSLSGVAPHIGRYIVEYYGQVFNSSVLSHRQREIIIISALIAMGDTHNQLKWHYRFALKAGISPEEAVEIATHCLPFCGFPRALNAIGVAAQLFAEQGLDVSIGDELLEAVESRRERGLAKLVEIDGSHGEAVVDSLAEIAPLLAEQIIGLAFGEIYSRSGLDAKHRQLVTLAALTAQGGCEPQLRVHLHAALRVGLTEQEIMEALLQCWPYTGFPKVLNAVNTAKAVFES